MKSVAIDEKEHRKNSPPDDNENQIETWIAAVFPIPTPFHPIQTKTNLLNSISTRNFIDFLPCNSFILLPGAIVLCLLNVELRAFAIQPTNFNRIRLNATLFDVNLIISFISYVFWSVVFTFENASTWTLCLVFDICTSFYVGFFFVRSLIPTDKG